MKKKTILICIMVLMIALALTVGTALAQEEEDLVPIKIENRTDQDLFITLVGEETFYGLPVGPNSSRTFSVRRGLYDQTTFACGESATGTVDMFRQLRLVFSPCGGAAPNEGAPSIEKVHLTDSPTGKAWQFQWD